MPKGTVKWFNNAKGFGFVTAEDGTEAFIHYSDIETDGFKSLEEGDSVEFELTEGTKGPKAVKVRKV